MSAPDPWGPRPRPVTDAAGRQSAARRLRANPFAGDDGSLPAALGAALGTEDPVARLVAVVGELAAARVLVPVVAHDHPGTDGRGQVAAHARHGGADPAGDACAAAALVSVRVPDGRAALPVFSSYDRLRAWDPTARPVPVAGPRAALGAVGESDGLLVLDPAADRPVLVPRDAVWALARGQGWVPPWADPDLPGVVTGALAGITELVGVRLEPSPGIGRGGVPELRVLVAVAPGLTRQAMQAAVKRAGEALGALTAVRERVDSLELYPVAAAEVAG